MTQFIQLHMLTSYPPSNLNRDDLGRPKTAVMGGKMRLRISSQSLKRAWRTSDNFQKALANHLGTRTKTMGVKIYNTLLEKKMPDKKAKEWAQKIAQVFGKLKKENKEKPLEDLEIEQLAHFSPEEIQAIDTLMNKLAGGKEPNEEDMQLLRQHHTAIDIAMFGRMLADNPVYNTEAAVQVAHAISVHEAQVEDDYFTAVDDLNIGEDNVGAAHIGELEYGAGLFYLYTCIDRDLLTQNLGGNEDLTKTSLRALVESATKVGPTGKQNSFASRAYASYLLAEKGSQQPRSLSVAFLAPVKGNDMLDQAIKVLEVKRANMEKVYGACTDASIRMNVEMGDGSLAEILDFVTD